MSGDLGAEVVVRAAHKALREHANIKLLLVGDHEELQGHVTRIIGDEQRLSIVHASEVVECPIRPSMRCARKKTRQCGWRLTS